MDGQTRTLPPDLEKRVRKRLEEWAAAGKVRRLWARDASLGTSADEASWLGWLGIAEDQVGRIDRLRRVADDVAREGFTRALLLGMGGSSLCPEVLKETFGRIDGFPEVLVLDSTDPAQIRAFERKRSEEHTSELQSRLHLVCRLLLEKKNHHVEPHERSCGSTPKCAAGLLDPSPQGRTIAAYPLPARPSLGCFTRLPVRVPFPSWYDG